MLIKPVVYEEFWTFPKHARTCPDVPRTCPDLPGLAGLARTCPGHSPHILRHLPGVLALNRSILEMRERTLPEGHPDIASSHHNIGLALGEAGKDAGSVAELRAALRCWGIAGMRHTDAAARAVRALADVLERVGGGDAPIK